MVKKEESKEKLEATKSKSIKPKTASKSVKKSPLNLSVENVGFKAGDVYQALATQQKALSVAEIAKVAGISKDEALLGLGWLFKEGKVRNEDAKIVLA
jgi:predicted DNA-binding transcriptional regulator